MAEIKGEENMIRSIREKYLRISSTFNELSRRLWAGNESISIGYGGIAVVSKATGISKKTIKKAMREIQSISYPTDRIRRDGGGRKDITVNKPGVKEKLMELVEPSIQGDPQSPMLWISRSLRNLSEAMEKNGSRIGYVTVGNLLHDMKYNLKGNRKTREGKSNPDRNEQFQHINDTAIRFMENNNPVISVDTKKKEIIGNFKNNGKEWKPPGEVDEVNVYDFLTDAEGKAIPYGIYDIKANEGWREI